MQSFIKNGARNIPTQAQQLCPVSGMIRNVYRIVTPAIDVDLIDSPCSPLHIIFSVSEVLLPLLHRFNKQKVLIG
jgi:hypothetical protein